MESDAWDEFIVKYYETYEKEPGRVSALAYDAATLVRNALENGATTAEEVAEYLREVENYDGVSCKINFKSTYNANDAVSIFRINDGMLARLE
jgi:ABC-type branched-subunit amino acid transport system substrate-binding protein